MELQSTGELNRVEPTRNTGETIGMENQKGRRFTKDIHKGGVSNPSQLQEERHGNILGNFR